MKLKLLCILLSVLMLLPMPGAVLAAETENDSHYDRAFGLLSYLEIFDASLSRDEIEADGIVTRGDFALYLARALNLDTTETQTLYYTDVSKSHYAFAEITALTAQGYLFGTGDKQFRPDAPVESKDAATLMAKSLGLVSFINSGAANDAFVGRVMRESSIPYSTAGNLTFRNMTVMIYNALQAEYYQFSSAEGGDLLYSRLEGDTLLYKTRGMRYVERGLLTAANGADIYGADYDAGAAVIDGVRYRTDDVNYTRLLGHFVSFVYADDDKPTLKWAADNGDSEPVTLVIGDEGGYDTQNNRFWYSKNNRIRQVNIAASAVMVYNGRPLESNASEVLTEKNTRVTLLSSKRGGSYDIVMIEYYKNLLVTGKNSDNYLVYDRYSDMSVSLDPDLYDAFYVEGADGLEYEWADVQLDSLLSIFESQDRKYMYVIASDVTVSGTVQEVDGEGKVIIDDIEYFLYDDTLSEQLTAGGTVTCYLDFAGYIASVQTSASADRFVGFALWGVYSEEEDIMKVKILSETGSINDYTAAEKLNINGRSYKKLDQAFDGLKENGVFKPQIMLCRLDGFGKLSRIDTASPDDGRAHPLTINRELKKDLSAVNQAMYIDGRVGVKMLTDDNTKVFSVPENLGNDFSRCFVATLRMWDDYRGAVSYRTTSQDTFYEQYIVTRQITYGDTASNHPILMIDKIYTTVNDDNEVIKRVICTSGSGTIEYEVAPTLDIDAYGLKRGDAVRVATTASNNNRVEYVSVVLRADSDDAVGASQRETPYATRTISAYAYDKMGSAVKVGWDSGAAFDEIIQVDADIPVAVYDSGDNRIYMGTAEDIKTYRTGGVPSKLLIQSYQGKLQRVFVYR